MESFASLSPERLSQLEKFKALFPNLDARFDDHYLWRFLSARDYNIPAAEQMFRNHLEWRKRMSADTILEEYKPPKVLEDFFCMGWFGVDKTGSPIRLDRVGRFDQRGLFRSACRSDMLKFRTAYMMEDALSRIKKAAADGKPVQSISFVLDMEGLAFGNVYRPFIALTREVFKVLEENYPQVLRRVIIINPPFIFPYVFSLVSRFMHENTRKKFLVVKDANYVPHLLNEIDAEVLPACYGGTGPNPDGSPGAPKFSGGVVPREFYMSEHLVTEGLATQEIAAGKMHDVVVEVQAGQTLHWDFHTDSNDLAFSVLFDDGTGPAQPIIATTRVECHQVPEYGSLSCQKAGKYIVRLDNSYSFFSKKTVHYVVDVLHPDGAHDPAVASAAETLHATSVGDGTPLKIDAV